MIAEAEPALAARAGTASSRRSARRSCTYVSQIDGRPYRHSMGLTADLYGRVSRQDVAALLAFLERYVPGWREKVWDESVQDSDDLVREWRADRESTLVVYASGVGVAADVEFAMIAMSPWEGRALGIAVPAMDVAFDDGAWGSDVPPQGESLLAELLSVLGGDQGFCTVEEPPPTTEAEWDEAVRAWGEYRVEWYSRWHRF